jgi:hypothetical protein
MFLKPPKASTDARVRSLLQKAARRGYTQVVDLALSRLDRSGDKTWLRSRSIVITFEECWPLAAYLSITPDLASKRTALRRVTEAAKQKDAASLGALAYAYSEGDESMLNHVPDRYFLRLISEAVRRPTGFFDWITGEAKTQESIDVIRCARQYLAAATWPWDKACILAGALLSTVSHIPRIEPAEPPTEPFPYWVALDKHTPEGKGALTAIAKQIGSSYRQLIWADFYFESTCVNQLLSSPWWEAEKTWRMRRAGLSLDQAEELWCRARPLVSLSLRGKADSLKAFVEEEPTPSVQEKLYNDLPS